MPVGSADSDIFARLAAAEAALLEESRRSEALNRISAAVAGGGDLERTVQAVVDGGVELTGAAFGAFFYNVLNDDGGSYTLYTLSGAPREAFERYPMPRNTQVFAPTFAGEGTVRSDDILADPRYGHNAPYHGMPEDHLPVRSYLAVSVKSRSGEVLGGLFFGHPQPGRFTARHESLLVGLAAQAAIAIDTVRLNAAAQRELEQRRLAEARQALLLNELNHRVKNTLATVQSIAFQTLRSARSPTSFLQDFEARLIALSQTHNLLVESSWRAADLRAILVAELEPYGGEGSRYLIEPSPEMAVNARGAVALGMAAHELATNAAKYGALSSATGIVTVGWSILEGETPVLEIRWSEQGGPTVTAPDHRGFGSRLIERGLAAEFSGTVTLDYAREGLKCIMRLPLKALTPEPHE